jgi:hypothetical protein
MSQKGRYLQQKEFQVPPDTIKYKFYLSVCLFLCLFSLSCVVDDAFNDALSGVETSVSK